MIVALIRHGRTEWNDAQRMQGRADIPLSPAGRHQVLGWRLPGGLLPSVWLASPLARAEATATLLAGRRPTIAPALAEMDWGDWEGRTLAELRRDLGEVFERNAARGMGFRPAGGESTAEVVARARAWFASLQTHRGPVVAVTHKGVIRAALALVTGWDMTGKPPVRLSGDAAHVLRIDRDGTPTALRWNVPLRVDGCAASFAGAR